MANSFANYVNRIFARFVPVLRNTAATLKIARMSYSEEVSKQGETIRIPLPGSPQVEDVVPGPTATQAPNTNPTHRDLVLSEWKHSRMFLTDKETHELAMGQNPLLTAQMEAHAVVLIEDIGAKLIAKAYQSAFLTSGIAGTTPFASNLSEWLTAARILTQQKAPKMDRHLILGPVANAAALARREILDASYRSGGEGGAISTGQPGTVLGAFWSEDQQLPEHTKGTKAAIVIDGAVAVGALQIVIDASAGTLVVGDILTIDAESYSVAENLAAQGVIVNLTTPVRKAIADNAAGSILATHEVNLALHRNALAVATRPTAIGGQTFSGGNLINSMVDPETGISLVMEVSRQNKQTEFDLSILYGTAVVRPEHVVRVLG